MSKLARDVRGENDGQRPAGPGLDPPAQASPLSSRAC
jgi:hypothetical protein